MKRIVVGVDGSPGAAAAVDAAIQLAHGMGGLCPRSSPPATRRRRCSGTRSTSASCRRSLAEVRPAVDAALAAAAAAGVPADAEVAEGDPAEVILDVARNWDADLVVVGSRDLNSFAGAVLGSVSRAVLHHADRPVLVIKGLPPAGARARTA